MKFRRLDDSTQHSQGAVELEWDLGEKVIRFVAHVVPGMWELLQSHSHLKALEATIDPRNDRMHLENPRATLKLSTTLAGHCEVDLHNRIKEAAGVGSLDKIPGSTLRVLTKEGSTQP